MANLSEHSYTINLEPSISHIIGQQDVLNRLFLLDKEERVPHAMLFVGAQGVGKMAVAIEFAKHMLKKYDPNGNAEAMVERGSHPDLIYSFPFVKPTGSNGEIICDDFKTEWIEMLQDSHYFSNDDWLRRLSADNKQAITNVAESNSLIKKLSLKSSQGGYKICIIWQAEKMNTECANKLLKIIEEPPTQTIFILTTEHPELILETIRSRTQVIDFKSLSAEEIAQSLVEKRHVDSEMAMKVARASSGSWLQALNIISGEGERQEFLSVFQMLMRHGYQKKVLELKQWSSSITSWGREKQKRFLDYCLMITRENFMYNFHTPELCYMTPNEEEFATKFSPFINEQNILDFNTIYNTAIRDISRNANANIVFYDMALKVIILLQRR